MGKQETASARVAVTRQAVFGLVIDIPRLPLWNEAITDVIEAPERLEAGSHV